MIRYAILLYSLLFIFCPLLLQSGISRGLRSTYALAIILPKAITATAPIIATAKLYKLNPVTPV